MATIEIRQSKKKLIPMLVLLAVGLFVMIYYVFFLDNNNTMKVLYVLLAASLAYAIYLPVKKFFKNEPVLAFNKSEIEINEKGKPVPLLWRQIIDWRVEKEKDGNTHYLIIETADKKYKINISWLEKRPSEIEALLQTCNKRR